MSATPTTNGRCASGVPERGHPLFDFAHLHRAWLDCRRGKGNAPSRWQFEAHLERNLFQLADELSTRRYRPSPSVCFVSDQPKRREIFAAAFRDRVVHHLLVRQLEPYWEPRFIHDSYACRRGKGTLAAVDRVQQFIGQVSNNGSCRAWYLHLDVRSFFVRIDKATLLAIVERGIDRQGLPFAEDLRWLLRQIVLRDPSEDAIRIGRGFAAVPEHKSLYHTGNRSGLPIGNYSSQFLANVHLDRLDQFVKHELKQRFYLRYVDDLLLMHRDPDCLRECEARIRIFLHEELKLELNDAQRKLAPTSNGIDALGWIVHRDHRLLRRRTVRRFQAGLQRARRSLLREFDAGYRLRGSTQAFERLLSRCASYAGLLGHCNSARIVQRLEHEHKWIRWLWHSNSRGQVRRRFRPTSPMRALAVQWRAFKRLNPGCRVLLQVGRFWEAFGADAHAISAALNLRPGRFRYGLGQGVGFRCADRERLQLLLTPLVDRPLLLITETSGYAGQVRARVVRMIFVPVGCDRAAPWAKPRPCNNKVTLYMSQQDGTRLQSCRDVRRIRRRNVSVPHSPRRQPPRTLG